MRMLGGVHLLRVFALCETDTESEYETEEQEHHDSNGPEKLGGENPPPWWECLMMSSMIPFFVNGE